MRDGSLKLSGGGFVHRLHQFNHSPADPHVGVFSYFRPKCGTCGRRRCCHVCPSAIQFGCGGTFYREASVGARYGKFGMSALGSFGTSAAKGSLVEQPPPSSRFQHCRDADIVYLFFFSFWKWLESKAKGSTGDAIASLLALQAQTALLVEEEDRVLVEREVDAKLLFEGDLVKVPPGAKIPADGIVEFRRSEVDESALTGESVPVPKKQGDKVVGATMKHAGTIRVRLFGVHVLCLLWSAWLPLRLQFGLAPRAVVWSRSRRSLTSINVSLTFFSLMTAVPVPVVACPCALGLAAPTAVMVGTGVGARLGVLIKGGGGGGTGERSLGEHRCLRQDWNHHKRSPKCYRS